MNLKTDIQIGFPIAVASETWEFVIVRSSERSVSLQGWFSSDNSGAQAGIANISDTGAGMVLNFNDKVKCFNTIRSFQFDHISATMEQGIPCSWEGHSDTAACTLAMAQTPVSCDAPIILVSCNCNFSPEAHFSGALLSTVSDSPSAKLNGLALYRKWVSATQRQESIVGLVLLDTDAEILLRWLKSEGLKCPQVIPVAQLDVMQLLTLPRSWPVLISAKANDLPQLAERLGIDSKPFKPTRNKGITSGGYRQIVKSGSAIWGTSGRSSLTTLQQAKRAIFNLRTFKLLSLSIALTIAGVFAARSLLTSGDGGGGHEPFAFADLSGSNPTPPRPIDLSSPPAPLRDLSPSLATVDLASKTPLRLPPGTIRQFGGCDMVLISAEVMPPGLVPFWIDRTEVTTEGFEKCVEAGRCNFDTATLNAGAGSFCNRGQSRAQHPMNCVTYDEAANYCSGLGKFVPTLAQWDYAARGDTARPYPWGETLPAADALCWKRLTGTCPVGQHLHDKSPFGVLGMGTNVGEWTSTKFYSDPNLSARVFRGWSWGTDQFTDFFGAKPHGLPAEKGQNNLGFRCARAFSETDQ